MLYFLRLYKFLKLLNQKMIRLEYESMTGKLFNVLFNNKTNKVVGIEYEDAALQAPLRTLELYNFVSLNQLKSMITRLIPSTRIDDGR